MLVLVNERRITVSERVAAQFVVGILLRIHRYTFAGTSKDGRYDRPSKRLASGSSMHVSVWASKRMARPVRKAMFPKWHRRVLLCPSSMSALGRLTFVPDEFLMQSMKLR